MHFGPALSSRVCEAVVPERDGMMFAHIVGMPVFLSVRPCWANGGPARAGVLSAIGSLLREMAREPGFIGGCWRAGEVEASRDGVASEFGPAFVLSGTRNHCRQYLRQSVTGRNQDGPSDAVAARYCRAYCRILSGRQYPDSIEACWPYLFAAGLAPGLRRPQRAGHARAWAPRPGFTGAGPAKAGAAATRSGDPARAPRRGRPPTVRSGRRWVAARSRNAISANIDSEKVWMKT